jgi:hypothetical protein
MSQPQYKIRVNPPKPTEKEVQQYKSFNRVLYQYQRKQKRRPLHSILLDFNKLVPVLLVATLIVLIFFYYDRFVKKNAPTPPPTEQVIPK